MSTDVNTHREDFIAGLRACADFLETHPAVPVPVNTVINVFVLDRAELANTARAAESWSKEYLDQWFFLRRSFSGDVRLEINAPRETVCRKVVTGTKVIPARDEEVVETFEWVCEDAAVLR